MLRVSGSRAVNYDDAPGAFVVPAVTPSGSPRYYVRSDGLAIKGEATDPSSPASAMNEATFNAATFAAGDIVEFDGRGAGDFSGIALTSGGMPGNPIYYVGSRTNPPRISVTTGSALAIVSQISHVRIAHFPELENTAGNGPVVSIDPGALGRIDDLEMLDVHVTRNRDAGSTTTDDCFHFDNTVKAILRNVSTKDSQVGTGLSHCLYASGDCEIEVYGADFTQGTQGVVAQGAARIRIEGGRFTSINGVSADATTDARVNILRSYVESTAGVTDGMVTSSTGSGTGHVRLKDSTYVVRAGEDKVPSGLLIFESTVIDFDSDAARYKIDNANCDVRLLSGCHLKLGASNFQFLATSGSALGDVTIRDSLLEQVSPQSDRMFAFGAGTGTVLVEGNVFKEPRLCAGAIRLFGNSATRAIVIRGNTFWNSVASLSSRVIENARTAGGTSVVYENNGAENFDHSFDGGDTGIEASFNGWFGVSDTAYGTDAVTGAPLMLAPESNDFRLPAIGSAWHGVASDGGDIGAGRFFR